MKISKIFMLNLVVLTTVFLFAEEADNYLVTSLPKDFYIQGFHNILNNYGQVAGRVSKEKEKMMAREEGRKKSRNANKTNYSDMNFDPLEGAKAAYWDQKKGLVTINFDAYKSCACSINDNGYIALSIYKEKQPPQQSTPRAAGWDTKGDQIKIGPLGEARYINKNNVILLEAPRYIGHRMLWNPIDNTVLTEPKSEDIKDYLSPSNVNGNKITQPSSPQDLFVSYDGKKHLLLLKYGELTQYGGHAAFLNDKDEVVSMTTVNKDSKKYHVITKWRKGREATVSGPLEQFKELKDYSSFGIYAFNNAGQILLGAVKPNNFSAPFFGYDLFLLTPQD